MTSNNISMTTDLVVVTGASGYLAGHIIHELLSRNYHVRGTVRSLKNAATKYRYLYEMDISEEKNALELVEADLSADNNWMTIISDADYVLHTASPLPSKDENGKPIIMKDEDFSGVTVQGMKRVLNACLQNKKLKKFVYTSSGSAMGELTPNKKCNVQIMSSSVWTDLDNDRISPYVKSKTLAEREMWHFAAEHEEKCFPVVSINPGLVLGPVLNNRQLGSLDMVKIPMNGELPFLPPIMPIIVDVRDCAIVHVNALETENANGKRYACMNQAIWLKDICTIVYEKYGDGYDIPLKVAPEWVFHMIGIFDPIIHDVVCPQMSIVRCIDNVETVRDLNVVWTPMNETIYDTAESLIKFGHVKKQSTMNKVMKSAGKLLVITIVFGTISYCCYKQGLITKRIPIFNKYFQ